jgi:hypothetical protein
MGGLLQSFFLTSKTRAGKDLDCDSQFFQFDSKNRSWPSRYLRGDGVERRGAAFNQAHIALHLRQESAEHQAGYEDRDKSHNMPR